MKNLNELNRYRNIGAEQRIYGTAGDSVNGIFIIFCPTTTRSLTVMASAGGGWEHVSVSVTDSLPSWTELDYIKRMFFRDDETVMQLHVPVSEHINCHPNCLHLWRPTDAEIPRPPGSMV